MGHLRPKGSALNPRTHSLLIPYPPFMTLGRHVGLPLRIHQSIHPERDFIFTPVPKGFP
jgi:hypothetical protein